MNIFLSCEARIAFSMCSLFQKIDDSVPSFISRVTETIVSYTSVRQECTIYGELCLTYYDVMCVIWPFCSWFVNQKMQ